MGLFGKILRAFPYSTESRIIDLMIPVESILDLGCSDGKLFFYMGGRNRMYRYAVGVDIFPPYVSSAKKMNIYDDLVMADARCLPFRDKSYDTVLASHVLEHISKGANLPGQIEKLARKQVIIVIPSTFTEQHAHDGNPFQRHISSYGLGELMSIGYRVYGIGINLSKLRNDFLSLIWDRWQEGRVPAPLRQMISLVIVLGSVLTYPRPGFASILLCTKFIGRKQCDIDSSTSSSISAPAE